MNDADQLFARLLCDIMIPAELSAAVRAQGYDVIEARTLPIEIQSNLERDSGVHRDILQS